MKFENQANRFLDESSIKSKKGRAKFQWIMRNIDYVFNAFPNALHLGNTALP